LLLTLLRSVQLAPQESLHLEHGLVLVDAELLEESIVVVLQEAFEHFEFHHVVVVLRVLRLDVADLGHGNAVELGVKLLDLLGKIGERLVACSMNAQEPLLLVAERDELVAEAKGSSTAWLHPLGHIWLVGRLQDVWS